jgi:glutamate-1-semialdehyde 2,1-aminomutase
MKSEELFKKSLKYVPGGVHSPVRSFKGLHRSPIFVNKSDGAFITDEDGKDYIDFCMSFGPLILGHKNKRVQDAVVEALENGWSYGACEKYSLELAEFIVNKIPFIDQIRFVNSGTEAVMTAIRLARGYTGKSKIIKFNGCYHGHTDAMLIKSGSGLAGTSTASSSGVSESVSQDTLVCELGDLDLVENIFKEHPNQIAALFIEPLPANYGLLTQNTEYLKGLRLLCDKYNALLIFDEVISGFRVAFGGMAEVTGVNPDMVTYGKIIGGGFPVGAVAAKKEIMEKLAPIGDVYQAGTLSANPIAMIAGLENLKQLTPEFYSDLESSSNQIVELLGNWLSKNSFDDYKIIQFKSLFWPVPTETTLINPTQIPENLNDRFYILFETLVNKGIYLSPNAYEIGFISSAHNKNILNELEKRLCS